MFQAGLALTTARELLLPLGSADLLVGSTDLLLVTVALMVAVEVRTVRVGMVSRSACCSSSIHSSADGPACGGTGNQSFPPQMH